MIWTPRRLVRRDVDPASTPLPGLHPVVDRVLRARGVRDPNELETGLRDLLPWQLLGGVDAACTLLAQTLEAQGAILVVGDFDADGATSSALAVRALRAMGATVDYLVPNRFEYGYGLTPAIVEVAARRRPALIVTVDNGIASLDGVAAAQRHGIRVLITDHHLPGDQLPAADAIVNPQLPGDPFPSRALAGVGVIFYVLLALRARLREQGWFERRGLAEPNMAQWLDLVALGTVADVVPLERNNRILVAQGLARIRAGHGSPGLTALIQQAGRDPARLTASDLGYAVAPRLNAAGRLEDMALGIELLLCDQADVARRHAVRLDQLNQERRTIEAEMREQAQAALDHMSLDSDGDLPYGLCLYDADWHQGVIGILASRVKERLNRPVIAFAPGEAGELKGSARSVPGLHIRDALDAVAARHPGLLSRFGGHAMAAGLTLPIDALAPFSDAFDAEVRRHLAADDLHGVVHSDGALDAAEMTLELARQLRDLAPWGQSFPAPLFDGQFEVIASRTVGEHHLRLVLQPPASRATVDAIAFFASEQPPPPPGTRLHIAYRLDVNHYRGRDSLQLMVESLALQ